VFSNPHMSADEGEVIEDLVIAVLAVNRWSLERVFSIKEGLAREGIFDFDVLVTIDDAVIAKRLDAAGYRRGDYFNLMMGSRLRQIAERMSPSKRREMMELLGRRDLRQLELMLLPLKGVGPSVFRAFLCLCEPNTE
jgi:hypothetical protein